MNPPDPRAGPVPGWLGRALEPVYRRAVARRNRRYDGGEGVRRFSVPVISVGNLSLGGTGKTPMVAYVVGTLLEWGRAPAIVMRGYKRSRAGAGQGMSDEQAEYAERFGARVTVLADPDRCRSIAALERSGRADVVVMDDGFQHRRVARDLDIVLLDATRDVFTDRLLPLGWLREPASSLARAGVVVLTRSDAVGEADRERAWERVGAVAPYAARVEARHAWVGLTVFEGGRGRTEAVGWLRGRSVVTACGIGNPGAFSAQARAEGATVVREHFMPDHHRWTGRDVRRLTEGPGRSAATCVLTTMKDWVKTEPLIRKSETVWCVPRLEMRITRGEAVLAGLLRGALGSVSHAR